MPESPGPATTESETQPMRGQWCGNTNPHGSHTWHNGKETVHCNGTVAPKPKKKGK